MKARYFLAPLFPKRVVCKFFIVECCHTVCVQSLNHITVLKLKKKSVKMPDVEINDVPSIETGEDLQDSKFKDQSDNMEECEPEEEWLDVLGSGDLKMKTLVKGESGTRPQTSDICTVKILLQLEDETVVEEESELTVELNGNDVVQGLDLILPLLDVGQKVKAIVKPRFAFGKRGIPPKIPPNTTVVYTVELLKVEECPELTSIPFEERKKKALFKKDKGNWWFSREDAQKAILCYRKALDNLDESSPYTQGDATIEMPEEIFRDFVQTKVVIYNNLAAAQIMIEAYDSALLSVEKVVQLEPGNVKALYRKGKILAALGKTDEAVDIFKKASGLEPENNAIRKELQISLKRQAIERQQAKSLYKKMLGSDKSPGNSHAQSEAPRPDGVSNWTKFLGAAAAATVAAGLAYGFSFKCKTLSFWE